MRSIRNFAIIAAASLALMAALPAAPAGAQQQDNLTGVATITNTARVPGTAIAYGTPNTSAKGVFCTFSQTAEVGTPSTVISVDVEDSAGLVWQTLGSSGAFAGLTGNVSIEVYPGAVATSVPSGLTVVGLKMPRIWRLRQVITGGTSSTGTANCDLLN